MLVRFGNNVRRGKKGGTDYSYYSIRFEKCTKSIHELNCEKFKRFSSTGEYIVDYIIVFRRTSSLLTLYEFRCVFDNVDVVRWEMEIINREPVDYGVDFNNGCLDSMIDQRSWCCTSSKSTRTIWKIICQLDGP